MKKLPMFFLLLFCFSAIAEEEGPERSRGSCNGRYWNNMDESGRLDFLVGYSEGLRAMKKPDNSELIRSKMPPNFQFDEVIKMVNEFYEEPMNIQIPIKIALEHISQESAGMDPNILEFYLRNYRRTYNTNDPTIFDDLEPKRGTEEGTSPLVL